MDGLKETGKQALATAVSSKIVIGAVAIGGLAAGAAWYFSPKRKQRELKALKVKYSKSAIPHYGIKIVREYADKARRGELYSWGSSWNKPIIALEWMEKNNQDKIYWSPAKLGQELYRTMKGVNISVDPFSIAAGVLLGPWAFFAGSKPSDPRARAWEELLKLNHNQVRLLHNWWIDHTAEGSTLYDWVTGEFGGDLETKVVAHLNAAGVGQFPIKNL